MNTESQNIEFKESWRDEYMKWICGFANAQGGTLYIGVCDNGEVCGIREIKKLMEDIPNKVRVYDNALEILNCGVLPDNWYVETLLNAHGSHPYNPDIANTFFRAGEIEAWGRGIERIVKACQEGGVATPEFRYDASGIWTVFKFVYPSLDSALETSQKTNQKTDWSLTEQQNDIIKYLREHSYATQKELCENIPNAALGGIRHNLARLQELEILKRVGGRKLGHWEIV